MYCVIEKIKNLGIYKLYFKKMESIALIFVYDACNSNTVVFNAQFKYIILSELITCINIKFFLKCCKLYIVFDHIFHNFLVL